MDAKDRRTTEKSTAARSGKLALSPGDAYAEISHAWLLRALGRGPEAIAAARRATVLEPLDAWTWVILGSVHAGTHELERAKEAFRRALEISPQHSAASYWLCLSLVATARAPDALALANRTDHQWMRRICTALAQHLRMVGTRPTPYTCPDAS